MYPIVFLTVMYMQKKISFGNRNYYCIVKIGKSLSSDVVYFDVFFFLRLLGVIPPPVCSRRVKINAGMYR